MLPPFSWSVICITIRLGFIRAASLPFITLQYSTPHGLDLEDVHNRLPLSIDIDLKNYRLSHQT
jgi:hypothetical protein